MSDTVQVFFLESAATQDAHYECCPFNRGFHKIPEYMITSLPCLELSGFSRIWLQEPGSRSSSVLSSESPNSSHSTAGPWSALGDNPSLPILSSSSDAPSSPPKTSSASLVKSTDSLESSSSQSITRFLTAETAGSSTTKTQTRASNNNTSLKRITVRKSRCKLRPISFYRLLPRSKDSNPNQESQETPFARYPQTLKDLLEIQTIPKSLNTILPHKTWRRPDGLSRITLPSLQSQKLPWFSCLKFSDRSNWWIFFSPPNAPCAPNPRPLWRRWNFFYPARINTENRNPTRVKPFLPAQAQEK